MNDNSNYNDLILVDLIHEKDEEAEQDLYNRYHDLIKYKAYKYLYAASKVGLDFDDLVQEGYIGLSQAVLDYRDDKETLFSTFANLCIEREIQTFVVKNSRKKHLVLNNSVSYHVETNECSELLDLIVSDEATPEQLVFSLIEEKASLKRVVKELTKLELKVFVLKYKGFNYLEIANALELTPKSVDNAIQRIRKKVSANFDN